MLKSDLGISLMQRLKCFLWTDLGLSKFAFLWLLEISTKQYMSWQPSAIGC